MNGKRAYGQVWTPPDIAEVMASWCARPGRACTDPAAGSGRLLDAASARLAGAIGVEIDPDCPPHGHPRIIGDFLDSRTRSTLAADTDWICNPPYLKHSSIPDRIKRGLHAQARADGLALRGTVGLHAFFMHRIVSELKPGARASILLPTDLFEGASATGLLAWATRKARLAAMAVLQWESGVFHGLDTRGVLLFMEGMHAHEEHPSRVAWTSIGRTERGFLGGWVANGFDGEGISTMQRALDSVLVSPTRMDDTNTSLPRLASMARVTRGLVAGHAAWSVMTRAQADARRLPPSSLRRIIRRAGDLRQTSVLTDGMLDDLDGKGVPTFLFAPTPLHLEHTGVREWIERGERMGVAGLPSMSMRKPWWRAEKRLTPPWLFAYFGGYTHRFIRNHSGAAPLTSHLCIYPLPGQEERLSGFLTSPHACDYLDTVGKCHGKSVKVEPRALERLAFKA